MSFQPSQAPQSDKACVVNIVEATKAPGSDTYEIDPTKSATIPIATSTFASPLSPHVAAANTEPTKPKTNASTMPSVGGAQTNAEEHVQNLATGLAGMVVTAPLAAVEAVSPQLSQHISQHISHAASVANARAHNAAGTIQRKIPDNVQQQAHGIAAQATTLVHNAIETVKSYIPVAQHHAANAVEAAKPHVANAVETTKAYVPDNLQQAQQQVQHHATNLTHQAANLTNQAVESAKAYIPGSTNTGATSTSGGASDFGRESVGDKVGAAVKPDSQKTYTESASDYAKGKYDQAASYIQPDSDKSFTQSATDSLSNKNITSGQGRQGLGDKLHAGVKPDSQKTYTDSAADYAKGT